MLAIGSSPSWLKRSVKIPLACSASKRAEILLWLANLKRLEVHATLRTVDAAQYRTRTTQFDFDAMVLALAVLLSPGNEQWIYRGSDAAGRNGSQNYAGVRNPVLDSVNSVIAALSDARSSGDHRAAARALDRVLMWGRHVLPLYHRSSDLVAHWKSLQRPAASPLYGVDVMAWWRVPQ